MTATLSLLIVRGQPMQTNDEPDKSELIWSEKYSIGNASIDNDHKSFFQMCNLLKKSEKQSDNFFIQSVIQMLEEYVDGHFLREEKAMMAVGYPRFADHRLKHGHFKAKVKAIGEMYHGGLKSAVDGLPELVGNWLTEHILNEDMKLKNWINDKAVDDRPLAFLALEADQLKTEENHR